VVQIKAIGKGDVVPLQALETSLTLLKSDQIVFCIPLDLYWRSPESSGVWYTSKELEKMIWFPCRRWIRR